MPKSNPLFTNKRPRIRIGFRFLQFIHVEGASGILLLFATAIAMILANSSWREIYFSFFETRIVVGIPELFVIDKNLTQWINDGLMTVFFFLVGLELKREFLVGELSSIQKAILPALAAVGGMAVPVLIFWGFNRHDPMALEGWAIPMATDIAFAIGVLTLIGRRAPLSLMVSLTALAVVDDLGAVIVIALFYTQQLHIAALGVGLAILALTFLYGYMGGRNLLVFVGLGVLVWLAFLFSGVHATIAGVLLALTIPVRTRIDAFKFIERIQHLVHAFREDHTQSGAVAIIPSPEQRALLSEMKRLIDLADSPLRKLELIIHPWSAYVIMPLFALANAGVTIDANLVSGFTSPLALGIMLGLFLGKPIGIFTFTWLAVKLGLGALPRGIRWQHVLGAGFLGGIGFTMAIFITTLAFGAAEGHAQIMGFRLAAPAAWAAMSASEMQQVAKMAIFTASALAGLTGFILLRIMPISTDSDVIIELDQLANGS
ncbi:MAG TPA: Na+/H+ antiporter NhaA [Anaerolineae bacterium]|nr:Na+/H+ antiporter NhaA [Anaerolineae bacterium]